MVTCPGLTDGGRIVIPAAIAAVHSLSSGGPGTAEAIRQRRFPGKRPMRICLCIPYFAPVIGGAERQASLLAEALAKAGDEVSVVTRHVRGQPALEVSGRVRIHRVIRPGQRGALFGIGYLLSLMTFFASPRAQFDVVHATGIHLGAYAACRLRRRRGFRVVVRPTSFGPIGDLATLAEMRFWPIWRAVDAPTRRHVLRTIQGADAVVALHGALADELLAHGFPSQRIVHIPNGVLVPETAWDAGGARAMRRTLGILDGPVLVFVGRLDSHKGASHLVRSLPELAKHHPGLVAILLGEGPLRDDLTSLAMELGVSANVRLPGATDPMPYLQAADIFVLPTLGEGMSNALLEAMAAGLPCVTTRVAGNIEVMTHGRTGLLVEPGDLEGLRRAIDQLLEDPPLRDRLGHEARERVRTTYSADQMAWAYRDLFARLVKGEGPQEARLEGNT